MCPFHEKVVPLRVPVPVGSIQGTLAPGASASAVSDRWHRIYRANRAVIGADPDLIQPEQRLRLPRR